MAEDPKATADAARAEQEGALKKLMKDALTEFLEENKDKQRTTGREVENPTKPKSFFDVFGI